MHMAKRIQNDFEPSKRFKGGFEPSISSYSIIFSKKMEQTGEIFRLNDDCFEAIFNWLHAEDLPAFGETCVRIQDLIKVYFARRYGYKRAEIARLNGVVAVKKYAALKEIIENISFCGKPKHRSKWYQPNTLPFSNDDIDLLIYYMNSQCNKNPKFLRFENMTLHDKEGHLIKYILKTVEVVEFLNCESDNFYRHILQHCKSIRSLTVHMSVFGWELEPWLQKTYPTLDKLDIQFDWSNDHKALKRFFKHNPQITKFACRSRLSSQQSKIDNAMSAITQKQIRLEELFLTIGGECDFRCIYIQLLTIIQQKQFMRLSLEFKNGDVKDIFIDNLNNLACLDKLYALHITNVDFAKDLPNNIDRLESLKELHLNNLANCDYSAKMIAMVTPNLELLVVRNACYFTPSVVDFIQPFIEVLSKLKKIILTHDVWARIIQKLPFLNEKRQKLQGAGTVTIWTMPSKLGLRDNSIIVGKTLVRMRPLYDEYEHI